MQTNIRKVRATDLPELKSVLDSTGLFPSDLLDDMIHDYLNNESSNDIWFTSIDQGKPISIAYCAPERMTEGTYNLFAIGVRKEKQGNGYGRAMMDYIEKLLKSSGQRILLVETSGKAEFQLTREFYEKCDYTKQAVIPEFYDEGDDKVVFWKKINIDD